MYCTYRVFYLPIFRRIEGGGWNPPTPGPYGTEKNVILRWFKYHGVSFTTNLTRHEEKAMNEEPLTQLIRSEYIKCTYLA